MHPNCRHEFIPVWLELMDKDELEKEIIHSQIPKASDPRLPEERNAYADWQAERRQVYNEYAYFEKARQTLGPSMPYKDIGAFRRSYRAKESSPAHQKSHNLIRDYKDYIGLKQVMRGSENIPKTLADFQDLRYNKSDTYYALLIGKAIREGRQPIGVEDGKQGKHCLPGPVCRPCGKHFFHAFGMGIGELSYSARED